MQSESPGFLGVGVRVAVILSAVAFIWSVVRVPNHVHESTSASLVEWFQQSRHVELDAVQDQVTLGRPTIIEYIDFECPFCRGYTQSVFPRIQLDYVSTGRIDYFLRQFPLTTVHAHALEAAEAAECARMQGRLWKMHDLLFEWSETADGGGVLSAAKTLGLNQEAFRACLTSKAGALVSRQIDEGRRIGVSGTPTFVLGTFTGENEFEVAALVRGALPYETFKGPIDKLLGNGTRRGMR